MSELSFLIELLLNHDLPKASKDLIASRIKEVEINLTANTSLKYPPPINVTYVTPDKKTAQAPSTLAIMAKHGDLPEMAPAFIPPVEQVAQIAQTPAAAVALNARNEAISKAAASKPLAGKPDSGRTSPRKW